MMDCVIIGCRTLENEIKQAMAEYHCYYPVSWIESGLHNVSKKLHIALQEALEAVGKCGVVLFAMGFCGNAVAGLQTGDFSIVLPRVDDCISLLLGSYKSRIGLTRNNATYFLTEGWLKGERNIWKEYEYTINKYGKETGTEIFDMMFGHYRTLALLDTGCYALAESETQTHIIADALKLEYQLIPATISYIGGLLTGPWDNGRFITIPPHSIIQESDLVLPD
jgi:hypothetical protein